MVFVVIVLGCLGLILGSFINALVWRLHETEVVRDKLAHLTQGRGLTKKKSKLITELQQLSILRGRSMCPACRHQLHPSDLIPVVSWIALKGRCRYCREPISWQYPVVEFLTALLLVISYLSWPYDWATIGWTMYVFWVMFIIAFVALAVYDVYWYLLPDKIVFPVIGLAVVELLVRVTLFGGGWPLLLHACLGVAAIAGVFYLLYIVSNRRWIGFGDVKLAIALGLLVAGPAAAVLVIFIASLLGTFIAMPMLVRKKATTMTALPFGPLLLTATVLVVLYGDRIIHWYMTFFRVS